MQLQFCCVRIAWLQGWTREQQHAVWTDCFCRCFDPSRLALRTPLHVKLALAIGSHHNCPVEVESTRGRLPKSYEHIAGVNHCVLPCARTGHRFPAQLSGLIPDIVNEQGRTTTLKKFRQE